MLQEQAVDVLKLYRDDPARLMADAGLPPDPWQSEFLRSNDTLNLMLCSRQVGKSSVCSILALYTALTKSESTVVVIAPIEPQANELIRKVVTAYNRIGRPLPLIREAVTTLEFSNGSRIIALPGKERSVHSYSSTLLLIDEAARVPDGVFFAASPQLSVSKGKLVALSTAFAKSGWFYEEWETSRKEDPDGSLALRGEGYRRWSVTANQCPRHTQNFLRQEKRRMGERWFNMAYANTFYDDLNAVFHTDDIAAATDHTLLPYFAQRDVASEVEYDEGIELRPYF